MSSPAAQGDAVADSRRPPQQPGGRRGGGGRVRRPGRPPAPRHPRHWAEAHRHQRVVALPRLQRQQHW